MFAKRPKRSEMGRKRFEPKQLKVIEHEARHEMALNPQQDAFNK